MNPWSTDPCWQNFSSLYREVVAAKEAPNEIGIFHHLTASLYFGMASLEAFINQKMRVHLATTAAEDQIITRLRKGHIMDKLKKWPKEILSNTLAVSADTMELLELFNELRGDLTHPKKDGHYIYRRLETVAADSVAHAVAEYIVRFFEANNEVYPYWLFGWNYLNPRPDTHEIIVINNQQFLFSLLNIGISVPASDADAADKWKAMNMSSFAGYLKIRQAIESIGNCEPKSARFPYQPKLCKRWWTEEHHRSCGRITQSGAG